MDTRTLECRFLAAINALAGATQTPRTALKALQDLPESAGAADAIHEAVLAGMPMDRLRSIMKASQGDSRRGRAMATRLQEWMDEGRPVPESERTILKATVLTPETPGMVGKIPDGFMNWQKATDAYGQATRQGLLEEGDNPYFSQAADIPRNGPKGHPLPGEELPLPGKDEPKRRKIDPKTDLVD
jgi:hypothetical protein